ncbi:MAG: FHA domain-containing protein [Sedimentisphaerales bacterium]|nr:FHA domain-containing protein [Sedimentisphaerales bacterium]
MQLVVKQSDSFLKEVHFSQGPVYIGREIESHLCLPDHSVDHEHAVLCGADETEWFAEHVSSMGLTLLNQKPIQRQQLRDGDVLTIGDYQIEVQLNGRAATAAIAGMSTEELAARVAARPPKNIIRLFDQADSPDLRMPPRRYKDYIGATLAIQMAKSEAELIKALLAVTVQQMKMLHTFIGIRRRPEGPFTCQVGKRRTGQNLKLKDLVFQHFITEAMEKKEYILIPILPENRIYERIRSALIAPLLSPIGCHGVIYADNAVDDPHYSLNDLDYLILLAVQAGARLRLMQ